MDQSVGLGKGMAILSIPLDRSSDISILRASALSVHGGAPANFVIVIMLTDHLFPIHEMRVCLLPVWWPAEG